jgi:hypothetical protein
MNRLAAVCRRLCRFSDDEDPFAMANLPPRLTGLPMVVWASERITGDSLSPVLEDGKPLHLDFAFGAAIEPGAYASATARRAPIVSAAS